MLKFEYNDIDISSNLSRYDFIKNKLNSLSMTGWMSVPSDEEIDEIIKLSNNIKRNSKCLVVIGIGGSYLGSCALYEMFKKTYSKGFEVIYLGPNMTSSYINDTIDYLQDKDFSLNVISKSGNTLEIKILFDLMLEYMKKRYDLLELEKRIIITTSHNSKLDEIAIKNNFKRLYIPDNIGGRYSLITSAHLLSLSLNINIKELIKGYSSATKYDFDAFTYACIRNKLYLSGKYIENFCFYDQKFSYYGEFLKQLFAESEGKNNVGIFPTYSIYTKDLHSIGQYIQDGSKIIFETTIDVPDIVEFEYKDSTINKINDIIKKSVIKAHLNGEVYQNIIKLDKFNEYSVGELTYFMFLSCAYSCLLLGVDPFNQDGVEEYKKITKENLKDIINY